MSRADLQTDVVILACAISAGIHGALTPSHFGEDSGAAAGFLAATALLASLAVAVTRSPSANVLAAAAVVLAGLLAGYALAVTTGVPVLHPDREPLDGLGLFTKGVEAAGLLASLLLLRRSVVVVSIPSPPKGTAT